MKISWDRVPLYPTNSGWQLVTGTIWFPYVLHTERRNVYPCSFHHYNNTSKEPPLSRKACRNTKGKKKKKNTKQQPHSTWYYPWKTLGTLKATQQMESALPVTPVGSWSAGQGHRSWTPSPAVHSKWQWIPHLFLFYKVDKHFTKGLSPSWCFLIIQALFGYTRWFEICGLGLFLQFYAILWRAISLLWTNREAKVTRSSQIHTHPINSLWLHTGCSRTGIHRYIWAQPLPL